MYSRSANSSEVSITNFVPLCKIGYGSFSSVYKVRRITDQRVYALKKIKISSLKEKEKSNALNEVRILASLASKYIVTYKEAFFDEKLNLLCIVMEWANEGDLLNMITEHRTARRSIPEYAIWKAAYQIIAGLYVMHSNAILHRDMKCANVFISDGVYKLGDLNVSKVNEHQSKLVRTQTGTPYYASPEVWRDEPYGSKSDIWSFGCILYEMCCMKPPFQGDDLSILYRNVQRGLYEPISSNYSNELGQLIRSCLKQNSRDRPSADQLLSPKGSIIQKCHYYQIEVDYQPARENKSQLLSTIRLPKDMKDLKKSLPIANYYGKKARVYVSKSSQEERTKQFKCNYSTNEKLLKPEVLFYNKFTENSCLPANLNEHIGNIPLYEPLTAMRRIQSSKYRACSHNLRKLLDAKPPQRFNNYGTPMKYLNPNYLISVGEEHKKRPMSCNLIRNKVNQQNVPNQPYYLGRLKMSPSVPISYCSDRKDIANRPYQARERANMSDRRCNDVSSRYYLNRGNEILQRNKYRCKSANVPGQCNNPVDYLRKRLYNRRKNLQSYKELCPESIYAVDNFKYGQLGIRKPIYPSCGYLRQKQDIFSDNYSHLQQIQSKMQNNYRNNSAVVGAGYGYHLLAQGEIGNGSRLRRIVKGKCLSRRL